VDLRSKRRQKQGFAMLRAEGEMNSQFFGLLQQPRIARI
jgi:hypothetical protein